MSICFLFVGLALLTNYIRRSKIVDKKTRRFNKIFQQIIYKKTEIFRIKKMSKTCI